VPITRENWFGSDEIPFTGYLMAGVPRSPEGTGEVWTTMLSVRRIDELPAGVNPSGPDWFFGQIYVDTDIRGMSGGPIFGFYRSAEGRWRTRRSRSRADGSDDRG
jgi:hypothetical protein